MKLKNILIAATLTVSLLTSTVFAATLTSFSDVPSSNWAYATIMQAVDLLLFNGTTTPDENGVAEFSPDDDMTRAQFLVVVARALGIEYDSTASWYTGAVEELVQEGIITRTDFSYGATTVDYNAAMTRQEMAYVMANVLEYTGETLNEDISSTRIPDYYSIGTYYQDEVVTVYSNGILQGTSSDGTFSPSETLNRAQAATVLIRLVDSTARTETLTDAEYYAEQAQVEASTTLTIYEGQTRTGRLAQAGDIYVKADGTQIVLEIDPVTGVLAVGQGVSADEGLIVNTTGGTMAITHNTAVNELDMTDSLGNKLQSTYYWINSLTSEGHFGQEWNAITSQPTVTGTEFNYQLSEDMNWFYFDLVGYWAPVYSNGQADILINNIIAANNL